MKLVLASHRRSGRMSKVYLINVGANTSHAPCARSPLFNDGKFEFVSFPCDANFLHGARLYGNKLRPFLLLSESCGPGRWPARWADVPHNLFKKSRATQSPGASELVFLASKLPCGMGLRRRSRATACGSRKGCDS